MGASRQKLQSYKSIKMLSEPCVIDGMPYTDRDAQCGLGIASSTYRFNMFSIVVLKLSEIRVIRTAAAVISRDLATASILTTFRSWLINTNCLRRAATVDVDSFFLLLSNAWPMAVAA